MLIARVLLADDGFKTRLSAEALPGETVSRASYHTFIAFKIFVNGGEKAGRS